MDFFAGIMNLISQNHLEEVFKALRAFPEGKIVEQDVILLERRYNEVKQDRLSGLISSDDAGVEKNRICNSLVELINRLEGKGSQSRNMDLSPEARTLLFEASRDPGGRVRTYTTKDGWAVQSNNKVLFEGLDSKKRAQWKEALVELCGQKLLNQLETLQNQSETYELTSKGFNVAEAIPDQSAFEDPRFGTFIDPRDNQEYPTLKLCGRIWLARNFNYDVGEGCSYYENDPKLGEKFGRLYSWEAAHRACPPGWRLPELRDWEELVEYFKGGHGAYGALLDGGLSGFGAPLGGYGYPDGEFGGLEHWGSYWTGTEGRAKPEDAFFFYFDREHKCSWSMNEKKNRCSVRFVRIGFK